MSVYKLDKQNFIDRRKTAANSTFAIGGVLFSVDCLVVTESLYLRINICIEKPAHRKPPKRYATCLIIHTIK
jgi:hypothetical protein